MYVQLPNGKTQRMSIEEYLNMSDEEFNELQGKNGGYEINDPFFDSALDGVSVDGILENFELPENVEEIPEDYVEEE